MNPEERLVQRMVHDDHEQQTNLEEGGPSASPEVTSDKRGGVIVVHGFGGALLAS